MSTSTARAPRRAPAQRRSEIAAAAQALALESGLAAVTLRAVATRSAVTPALVAHYVPSMDDLVAATFARVVDDELQELLQLTASGTAALRTGILLRALLDGTRDDVTLVWVEAWALGRRNETLAAAVRAAMDDWQRALRSLLEDGVAEGSMRVDSAADAAWQLLGMIDGVNAQSLVRWGGGPDRSALMEHAVEGLLGMTRGSLGAASTASTTPEGTS